MSVRLNHLRLFEILKYTKSVDPCYIVAEADVLIRDAEDRGVVGRDAVQVAHAYIFHATIAQLQTV